MSRSPVRAGFLLLAALAVGCASHQAQLQTAMATLNAARDGFVAWDRQHQADLVKQSTTIEAAKSALDEYRTKRAPVLDGFQIAYQTLAAAALEPTSANLGALLTDLADLEVSVTALGAAWPKVTP